MTAEVQFTCGICDGDRFYLFVAEDGVLAECMDCHAEMKFLTSAEVAS